MRKSGLSVLTLVVLASGCYRATVDTGRVPSGQTVEKHWAHGWVYGLVPPSTVETAAKCPNGVAKVETQLSFANQLVGFLTGGIYTPMSIEVQCAAAGTSLSDAEVIALPAEASTAQLGRALNMAAERAVEMEEPVYVTFTAAE